MIREFKGENRFLSNFYMAPVTYNGFTYTNSEAAFHAQKTLDENIRKEFTTLNPSEAKRKGRNLDLRPDWEKVKVNIMYEIIKAKFSQNEDIRYKLLYHTGREHLEEDTTGWHDNYWGNCRCEKCTHIKGRNKLGKILMKVREELRDEVQCKESKETDC